MSTRRYLVLVLAACGLPAGIGFGCASPLTVAELRDASSVEDAQPAPPGRFPEELAPPDDAGEAGDAEPIGDPIGDGSAGDS